MNKTQALLLSLILFSASVFAQAEIPKDIALSGKILSYEISVLFGDTINPKESLVETALFDNKGHILELKNGYSYGGGLYNVKKYVYKPGKSTIYECRCKDIESFENEFTIHDRTELKKQPGYGTAEGPSHWVTINSLDKKGNVTHEAHYSRAGYRTQDIWIKYDSKGNPVSKTVYNMDSVMTMLEKNSYDSKSNVIEKTVKYRDSPESKTIFSYDGGNNVIEKRYFEEGQLGSHIKYSIKTSGNTKEFLTTNLLTDTSYVERTSTYNPQNREIDRLEYSYNGKNPRRTSWEYFDNGNIKSISRYSGEDKLQKKTEYEYDNQNNWIRSKVSQLVNVQEKETIREEYRTTKYLQRIIYKPNSNGSRIKKHN